MVFTDIKYIKYFTVALHRHFCWWR